MLKENQSGSVIKGLARAHSLDCLRLRMREKPRR